MTTKHTPGPWLVGPLDGKYYGTWVAIGPHQGITVWTPDHYAEPFASDREVEAGWMPEDGHDHVEDVRSYANARLIAAAPDLLAALRAAVDCGMVPISSAREGGATAFSQQARVADQIRDAIANAEGR